MSTRLTILDTNLGIQDVLPSLDTQSMPGARPLPQTSIREAGLEALFHATTTSSLLESALTPNVGDGTILTPAIFSETLRSCCSTLKDVKNPDVHSFVAGELEPLIENEDLLQAYAGLLVGG